MKTHTLIYGYDFSTEMVQIDYSDGVGYILLHCVESPLGKECEVLGDIFPVKLNYELFKDIHNAFISKKLSR